jgi:lipopolysaccharide export LptBFGC system permease protein LptF
MSHIAFKIKKPYKQGLLAFVLAMVVTTVLFTIIFFYKYSADLFQKNLDLSTLLNITILTVMSLIMQSLPISILVMSIAYYRQLYSNGQTKLEGKSVLAKLVPILALCFIWAAFVAPEANRHQMALLFDISSKPAEGELGRINRDLFKGKPATTNFLTIGVITDSISLKIEKEKKQYLSAVSSSVNDESIDTLMMEASAKELKLARNDFSNAEWKESENHFSIEEMKRMQNDLAEHVNYLQNSISRFDQSKMKMRAFPFTVLVMFVAGMLLGFLNRNSNLIHILLGIYFVAMPGYLSLENQFLKLVKSDHLTPLQAQLLFDSCLVVVLLFLYWFVRREVRNSKQSEQTFIGIEE